MQSFSAATAGCGRALELESFVELHVALLYNSSLLALTTEQRVAQQCSAVHSTLALSIKTRFHHLAIFQLAIFATPQLARELPCQRGVFSCKCSSRVVDPLPQSDTRNHSMNPS
mmetsp:Transcript_33278/g.54069  ORF Transcript_33278/g.54069 Transcript_33278/m.54069 type:complete len:114 (-) Transcript_33278:111-452(-)